jgi:hypothetical protein
MIEHGQFTWGKPFWDQPLWRGQVHVVADLARAYGFSDIDGTRPRPLTLDDV